MRAKPNPGLGAYAAVLLHEKKRLEVSGGFRKTTNNRMEMLAALLFKSPSFHPRFPASSREARKFFPRIRRSIVFMRFTALFGEPLFAKRRSFSGETIEQDWEPNSKIFGCRFSCL